MEKCVFLNLVESLAYNKLWLFDELKSKGYSAKSLECFDNWCREHDIDLDYFSRFQQLEIFLRYRNKVEI